MANPNHRSQYRYFLYLQHVYLYVIDAALQRVAIILTFIMITIRAVLKLLKDLPYIIVFYCLKINHS